MENLVETSNDANARCHTPGADIRKNDGKVSRKLLITFKRLFYDFGTRFASKAFRVGITLVVGSI
jgi:hypothetical protein